MSRPDLDLDLDELEARAEAASTYGQESELECVARLLREVEVALVAAGLTERADAVQLHADRFAAGDWSRFGFADMAVQAAGWEAIAMMDPSEEPGTWPEAEAVVEATAAASGLMSAVERRSYHAALLDGAERTLAASSTSAAVAVDVAAGVALEAQLDEAQAEVRRLRAERDAALAQVAALEGSER